MSSKRKDSYGILLLHLATSGHYLQCLYIPCLPLLIFSMISCNVKLYLFLSMAFVADVIKNMYRYMVHWYICMYIWYWPCWETILLIFSSQKWKVFFLMFLAHLNWKVAQYELYWSLFVRHPSVCLSVNFLPFPPLQNHWADFNQTKYP